MNQTNQKFLLTILICCVVAGANAQTYSIGGGLIFNMANGGLGLDVRTEHPVERIDLLNGIALSPQLAFFPALGNEREEFYLGISGHLNLYQQKKWIFYSLVNISYRGWMNYQDSDDTDAHFSEMAAEVGLGVTRYACLRPFAELRLNVIGMEPNIRAGVLYTIRCDVRGAVPCSRIPPQPQF